MKCFVYKQRRKKNGKQAVCRHYRGRYRIEADETFTDVALGVCDKQVALTKLDKIVRRIQQERAGILPSTSVQQAFSGPLEEYLKNFAAELRRLGRDDRYVMLREASIRRLFKECKWKLVTDIQPASFINWRQKQTSSPKTLNDYLLAANTFVKWLIRFKRLDIENPLKFVEKISEAGKETYQRRPCNEAELNALIKLPTRRNVLYLTAAHPGLRREELRTLSWSDVSLDCGSPFIAVQAANAKNKKVQPIPLHPEVVEALKAQRDKVQPMPSHKVFRDIYPDWKTFGRDLKRAGITNAGDPNGKVHFHSLRHTLNHRLQTNGVAPTVAQNLMRHSDFNLTTRTYINAASLPLVEAIQKVPAIIQTQDASEVLNSPIDSPVSVPASHLVSQTVRKFTKDEFLKFLQEEDLGPDLTFVVTTRHEVGKSWENRIQSCTKTVDTIWTYPILHTARHTCFSHTGSCRNCISLEAVA